MIINKRIEELFGNIIYFCVAVWFLIGSKVRYGKRIKTPYGYKQRYYLEVWGKEIK